MKRLSIETAVQPRVAVVILNFNGWDMSIKCLDSLARSQYPNIATYLIDNASQLDLTAQINSRFPLATIIRNELNLGFSKGVNVGLRAALEQGFDYVWVLNNDTTVSTDTLKELVAFAEADADIGIVGCVLVEDSSNRLIQSWGGGTINLTTGIVRHVKKAAPVKSLDYINGASMLLRYNALKDVGLFDENYFMYWEDIDLSMRMRAHGWQLGVAKNAVVNHMVSATIGRNSWNRRRIYLRSAKIFLNRYSPAPKVAVFCCTFVQLLLSIGAPISNFFRPDSQ